jgi:hypothetical protein
MLVQRRNQPHLWVHHELEDKFRIAEKDLGRTILLGNVKAPNGIYLAAWRSDASNRYLWDLSFNGGSTASNPDYGPRTHSRGVGADLLFYGADVLAACARAGIVINYVKGEGWHVQLPNYTRYPIIRTNALATNGLGVPIAAEAAPTKGNHDMMIHRSSSHKGDFLIDGNRATKFVPHGADGGGKDLVNQMAKDLSVAIGDDDTLINSTITALDANFAEAKSRPNVWFPPIR